jgi:hypothetical protein
MTDKKSKMDEIIEHHGQTYKVEYQHSRNYELLCDRKPACNLFKRSGWCKDCMEQESDMIVSSTGGYTIATITVELAQDKQGKPMSLLSTVSECSEGDTFNKKIGREVARKRLIEILDKIYPS